MKKLFLIAMVGLSLALIIVQINFVISDFLIDNLDNSIGNIFGMIVGFCGLFASYKDATWKARNWEDD